MKLVVLPKKDLFFIDAEERFVDLSSTASVMEDILTAMRACLREFLYLNRELKSAKACISKECMKIFDLF